MTRALIANHPFQIKPNLSIYLFMKSTASAIWTGGLTDGKGTISSGSGVLDATPYSFRTRFEGEKGTNPEELIAASHAGCFSMALSMILGMAGFTADKIETKATVSLEKVGEGFEVTKSHLELVATVPGADEAAFQDCAAKAKVGCPISKLLKCEITLDAKLA